MLNLDPRLLDQDAIQHEKRKKYFKIAAIPLVFLLLFSGFFVRTGIYNLIFSIGDNTGNYTTPELFSNFQTLGNVIDPYLPYYDRGYLKLLMAKEVGDLSSAENDFQESLKNNPPESQICSIIVNYSYAIELEGDLYFESKDYDKAIVRYTRAGALLYENNCASKSSDNSGKDELAEEAKERLSEKRKATIDAANNLDEEDEEDETEEKQDNKEQMADEETLKQLKEDHESRMNAAAGALRGQYGMYHGADRTYGDPNF